MSKGLQPGSMAYTVANLAQGDSYSRTKMIGMSRADLDNRLRDARRRLRNTMTKQVERASKETGNTYRLDTGTWIASEDATVFLTVSITRII